MKILHSADWHLGKKLEGYSRLDEQKLFLTNFCEIADEQKADLVIVAGDIYDHTVPPADAENLLFKNLAKLSNNGDRLILLIAGNHDNPEKITATAPLAMPQGIIFVGTPKTVVPVGDYGNHKVLNSSEGMIEVEINGEIAVILTTAFPSEKTLNEVIYKDMSNESERNKAFNDRIRELFKDLEKFYRDDTINLVTSHLLTTGIVEEGSERSLGGASSVSVDCFPEKAQYIALGHIHKPFKVPGSNGKAIYSGSPLQYNVKERNNKNQCILIDVVPQQDAVIKEIPLKVYKPIEVWEFDSIEDAIKGCKDKEKENIDRYVYLEIKTDRAILSNEIDSIRATKNLILDIIDKYTGVDTYWDDVKDENRKELSSTELFKNLFKNQEGILPSEELILLFDDIFNEELIEPETDANLEVIVLDEVGE